MAPEPEKVARETIDKLLTQADWLVCDASQVNIHAARGVAIREFPLPGHGFSEYGGGEKEKRAFRWIRSRPFRIRSRSPFNSLSTRNGVGGALARLLLTMKSPPVIKSVSTSSG